VGVFLKKEKVEQVEFSVHKPQVFRSVTHCSSKASPGAYSSHKMLTIVLLYFNCM
jgi:hypothetical protein